LPAPIRVVVKTARDLIDRFRRSLLRPVEFVEGVSDSGAVHPPGESSLVDPKATLETYRRIHAAGRSRLNAEATFLREGGFAAVVSDIASLPLRAARLAGIPGILLANFTWHDIFKSYIRGGLREYRDMLDEMQREYNEATLVLRAQPAIARETSVPVKDVGLVARRGRGRRQELRSKFGLRPRVQLVYMYVGRYGQDDMEWQNLSRLSDFDFISYHGVPDQPAHWHVVDPTQWSPADLAASVDVMVAKAGYGTVTDAMVHRTPIVFPPRFGFVEHKVLADALRRWGGGLAVGTSDFKTLNLRGAIERLLECRPRIAPWPTNGAIQSVREIMRITRMSRRR
jgi:hypothetical protein